MSAFLGPAVKKRKMQYDRANLQRAFDATKTGMSVYKAAMMYSVPESTLRDRTRGIVDMDTTIGFETIFSTAEEKKLVEHITYMANIGYGYNKIGIQYMAKEYAKSLGKSFKSENALSNCWFYGFLKRWSDLKVLKPQKLSIVRAQSASKEKLEGYYKELSSILNKNDLKDKPERIFNIDETGVNTEHSPPKIVCDGATKPQAIASTRSSTITIIAGGNAIGNCLPPYYIFSGKRWNNEFLNGCLPGSSGEMSDSGWSNTQIFNNYITTHFVKYAGVTLGKDHPPTLILYDGHRSHINLTLTDWAKRNNVILFVLPPHTSHITQPLDVAVFGPLKGMYNKECQLYLQRNPGVNITKYQVAELTNKPYMRALTSENLMAAFRKTGIYPFNRNVIDQSQVAPSVIYEVDGEEKEDDNSQDKQQQDETDNPTDTAANVSQVLYTAEAIESQGTTQTNLKPIEEPTVCTKNTFLEERTIKTVAKKPKRKFKPPFLAGSLLKKQNQDIMHSTNKGSSSEKPSVKSANKGKKVQKAKLQPKVIVKREKTNKQKCKEDKPSTSGINKKGGPIELDSEDTCSEDFDEIRKEDLCCVCGEWQPKELRGCVSVVISKWGQCDVCNHWTHLIYCSPVRVLRLHDEFKCPHCSD